MQAARFMGVPILSQAYRDPARSRRSAALFESACEVIPGGVNSTARARWSGWDPYPLFVERGTGSRLTDADGNDYIDYLLGLGPMILGHRPPAVTRAVVDFIEQRGTVFALPTAQEAILARKMMAAVPSLAQVRLCNTGTEAVLYAVRLARAFTGRQKVIRFEGMYHGFSDGVYWSKHPSLNEAGPDAAPVAVPQGPGLPAGVEDGLIILPWNDTARLRAAIEAEGPRIAAVLTEPVMCNTGCILPEPGYLEAMRELTAAHGIVLIFDEVITGFRLGLGGAQGRFGITPDLSTFAKGLGGGFPVAALGGRADLMALVADGTVSMAGTYCANGIAVAAANAALDELATPGRFDALFARSERLRAGLEKIMADAGIPSSVPGLGPVLQVWFSEQPIRNYRDAARFARHDLFRAWWEGMLERGVLFHPGAFENLFVSFAHSDDDVAATLDAARATVRTLGDRAR
jgi:glutamate-1-semialdehyde 2,1-aminomutase